MRRFIAAFCNNTVFANILLVMIFTAGILAAANMIRETFPEFSVDVIQISVMYPGADPEEVEEGISRKIEEAIDGLEGIKQYTTMSNENISGTVIEVLEDYDVRDVKDRVEN
jgi:multidrug efflux pump subunit AcrB